MKTFLLFIFYLIYLNYASSQTYKDSIVLFSDLEFHSNFEKEAFKNFAVNNKDTINLLLAIDKNINDENVKEYQAFISSLFNLIREKALKEKTSYNNVKKAYRLVKNQYLKIYSSQSFFPLIFETKKFNCVSSSILFALIFEKFNVPYNLKLSANHVYIIANPDSKPLIIDPSFPKSEKKVYSKLLKNQNIKFLKDTVLKHQLEFNLKPVDNRYEQIINEASLADLKDLPGIQYYNKTIEHIEKDEYNDAYLTSQKAYYFFQNEQTKILLYNTLLYRIRNCEFDTPEDIDLLLQLARFENVHPDNIVYLMFKIIEDKMQFFENDQFCDSLYNRFIHNCSDTELKKELSFIYNLQLSIYRKKFGNSDKYLFEALSHKPENEIALELFKKYLKANFDKTYNNKKVLDSLLSLENTLNHDSVLFYIKDYKNIIYLRIIKENLDLNNIKEADKYLKLFKENVKGIKINKFVSKEIESTYRKMALYYYYKKNKVKMNEVLKEGLRYVPDSNLLKLDLK